MKEWIGSKWALPGLAFAVLGLAACAAETGEPVPDAGETGSAGAAAPARELGPVDGRDLLGTDLGRVALGDPAPDFTLETYRGETLTLSENRGRREILLVFYRGAW